MGEIKSIIAGLKPFILKYFEYFLLRLFIFDLRQPYKEDPTTKKIHDYLREILNEIIFESERIKGDILRRINGITNIKFEDVRIRHDRFIIFFEEFIQNEGLLELWQNEMGSLKDINDLLQHWLNFKSKGDFSFSLGAYLEVEGRNWNSLKFILEYYIKNIRTLKDKIGNIFMENPNLKSKIIKGLYSGEQQDIVRRLEEYIDKLEEKMDLFLGESNNKCWTKEDNNSSGLNEDMGNQMLGKYLGVFYLKIYNIEERYKFLRKFKKDYIFKALNYDFPLQAPLKKDIIYHYCPEVILSNLIKVYDIKTSFNGDKEEREEYFIKEFIVQYYYGLKRDTIRDLRELTIILRDKNSAIDNIGISGSLMVSLSGVHSDFDLIIYGKKMSINIRKILRKLLGSFGDQDSENEKKDSDKRTRGRTEERAEERTGESILNQGLSEKKYNSHLIRRYSDKELLEHYKFRTKNFDKSISFDTFKFYEARKLHQFFFKDNEVFLRFLEKKRNAIKNNTSNKQFYSKLNISLGRIIAEGVIIEDGASFYTPGIYTLKLSDIKEFRSNLISNDIMNKNNRKPPNTNLNGKNDLKNDILETYSEVEILSILINNIKDLTRLFKAPNVFNQSSRYDEEIYENKMNHLRKYGVLIFKMGLFSEVYINTLRGRFLEQAFNNEKIKISGKLELEINLTRINHIKTILNKYVSKKATNNSHLFKILIEETSKFLKFQIVVGADYRDYFYPSIIREEKRQKSHMKNF
ncbi:MAG: hypothetical protein ACTSU2_11650 [Promethearchaeota archaeon]